MSSSYRPPAPALDPGQPGLFWSPAASPPVVRAITLLTDFGWGEYVAQMKGVLLSQAPAAHIVDIAHDVPAHSVDSGAYVLWAAAPRFPPTTVHVAVVDPGVGTARRGVVVQCDRGILVGPDNGLLFPAAKELGHPRFREIEAARTTRNAPSPTFHGRDVFAPVAARIARGKSPSQCGPRIRDPVPLDLFDAAVERSPSPGRIAGRILHEDRFGNLVTNLPMRRLRRLGLGPTRTGSGARLRITVGSRPRVVPFVRTYDDQAPGTVVCLEGSLGLLEIACTRLSAAEQLRARAGTPVRLTVPRG